MLGYDLLQHLSAMRSQSGPDVGNEVRLIRAVGGMNADHSLGQQLANFDSLPQLRWPCSQAGTVHR